MLHADRSVTLQVIHLSSVPAVSFCRLKRKQDSGKRRKNGNALQLKKRLRLQKVPEQLLRRRLQQQLQRLLPLLASKHPVLLAIMPLLL